MHFLESNETLLTLTALVYLDFIPAFQSLVARPLQDPGNFPKTQPKDFPWMFWDLGSTNKTVQDEPVIKNMH